MYHGEPDANGLLDRKVGQARVACGGLPARQPEAGRGPPQRTAPPHFRHPAYALVFCERVYQVNHRLGSIRPLPPCLSN